MPRGYDINEWWYGIKTLLAIAIFEYHCKNYGGGDNLMDKADNWWRDLPYREKVKIKNKYNKKEYE